MAYIDTRSYNQYDMWMRLKKPSKWLSGYKAGFGGASLQSTASEDYAEGYKFGSGDLRREMNPPHIKGGFSYGHGFKSDDMADGDGGSPCSL